jgi:hypothetical protein
MNQDQIREGLESGRNHPYSLLIHLHKEDNEQGARLVADIGERYVTGKERLQFRSMVHGLYPDVREAEQTQRRSDLEKSRQQNSSSLGAAIQEKVAEKKARGPQGTMPSGGSWQTPLDIPR